MELRGRLFEHHLQIGLNYIHQSPNFPPLNMFFRPSIPKGSARFHLDKVEDATLNQNQIHFEATESPVPI